VGQSRTSKFYKDNPEAAEKRRAYQREYDKKPRQKERRKVLNKKNRDEGTYGNGDNLDWSHTKRGFKLKPLSKNRGSKDDQPGDRRARGGKCKK
jgi:hypothetical protein